ncbi:MAG: zinc/manganese transport system substrate-binding protein [Lentisphaeria bacterium]|jgi:zinc/manganese transport system substrate-binding protein
MHIVVHHDSWIYLEEWLNLTRVGTLETKPGVSPTSGNLVDLLKQMKLSPATMIIHAAYESDKPDQWLSEKTGIPVVSLPFTIGGSAASVDFFYLYEDTFARMLKVASP